MKKRSLRVLGFTLLLIGAILLLNSLPGITGLVILESITKQVGSILGIAFISAGVLLFAKESLEKRIKYESRDKNINAFRRELERREHHKVSYEDAKDLYEEVEKKYYKSLAKGEIKRPSEIKPLEYIERYIKTHYPKPEPIIKKTEKKPTSEAGEWRRRGKVPSRYELLSLVEEVINTI